MSINNSFPIISENEIRTNISSNSTEHIDRKFEEAEILTGMNGTDAGIIEANKRDDITVGLKVKTGKLILTPPETTPFQEYSKAIQKWEGKVISFSNDTFKAILTPIVGDGSEQEAEIYIEDITPNERSLIEPGAVFYWSIGYLERPAGRVRESVFRFRRLPTWTEQETKKPARDLNIYFDEVIVDNDR
jgi:hypothetical protein